MPPVACRSQDKEEHKKQILDNWSLDDLLSLQIDLAQEISRRVESIQELQTEPRTLNVKVEAGSKNELQLKTESLGAKLEEQLQEQIQDSAREDLPATQIEKKQKTERDVHRSPGSSQLVPFEEFLIPGTLDLQSKEVDLSSPLRPRCSRDARSQKSSPIKTRLAVISDSEGDIDWSDTAEQEVVDEGFVESKNAMHEEPPGGRNLYSTNPPAADPPFAARLNFNGNPLTKKPWIFEDFKVNELAGPSRESRPSAASKFSSTVGKPLQKQKLILHPERGFEVVVEDCSTSNEGPTLLTNVEFANMRQRSKSPPGFGRLDFPNTQENMADVIESREILYNKTKDRFLTATRSDLSPSKRPYVFRNVRLNAVVNEGNFEWDPKSLQIFSRAKVRNQN
ncbi:LADA_0G04060g1_1 [Lachancea dasiensis]|uniref:LADA_0G04060g1_1 n=1 Tax=Lachancea dasiensis TaxID=1072105 RepID=A0A1G4JRY3_9SACH|nr:LADA_0G04060g1_1 [Lachancea dasiensis]